MAALDFALGPSSEVIVAGDPQKEDTANMLRAIWSEFIPRKVMLFRPSVEEFHEIADLAKFTKDLQNENGKATAFVCRNHACNLPTTDTLKMLELLDQQRQREDIATHELPQKHFSDRPRISVM